MKPKTNEALLECFLTGIKDAKHRNLEIVDFKLYNYGTLIAWYEYGELKITNITYSVTTSKLCGILRDLAETHNGETPELSDPPQEYISLQYNR